MTNGPLFRRSVLARCRGIMRECVTSPSRTRSSAKRPSAPFSPIRSGC
jgi:hypothetical protein